MINQCSIQLQTELSNYTMLQNDTEEQSIGTARGEGDLPLGKPETNEYATCSIPLEISGGL